MKFFTWNNKTMHNRKNTS
ncbi:hypothetical protein CGLO_07251 [Colletotrichum gloeosporioides Cg-14]|uniref:Uncharacterized protein n=1 Tax=Colletotrichum gloeosporioides (strain Cg-14) TaxID=1237896 RepID=T0LMY2_COLGC|nr:hypothetical protein CGLO_07251 [Colletotrichum gloeosporioides Cg-14]